MNRLLGQEDLGTGCYDKEIYVEVARTRRSMYRLLGQEDLSTGCQDKELGVLVEFYYPKKLEKCPDQIIEITGQDIKLKEDTLRTYI